MYFSLLLKQLFCSADVIKDARLEKIILSNNIFYPKIGDPMKLFIK